MITKITRNGKTYQIQTNLFNPTSLTLGPSRRAFISGTPSGDLFETGGGEASQVSKLLPEQEQLLRALISQISPGQGVTPYGGERVAGAAPLQETAFDLAQGYAPGVQAGFQATSQFDPTQAGRFLDTGQEALTAALAPFDTGEATDYWQKSLVEPATKTFRQEIIPAIMESSVRKAGTSDSGPMQRELARAGVDLASILSSQLGGLLYGGGQAQKGRQLGGAQLAGQLAGVPGNVAGQGQQLASLGLGQMTGMGTQQRGIGQQFLTAEQKKWMEAQPYMNPWLQQYLSTALGTSAFDTVISPQEPSVAEQLAPYAGAAMMASDIRVKENIEPIDNALEKLQELTGCMFDYKKEIAAEDRRHGGVMAQDLEKVLPDAVTEKNGIKQVDMNAVIGLLVNAVNELSEQIRST